MPLYGNLAKGWQFTVQSLEKLYVPPFQTTYHNQQDRKVLPRPKTLNKLDQGRICYMQDASPEKGEL